MSNKNIRTEKKEKTHISIIITVIIAAIVVIGAFGYAIWNNSDAALEKKIALTVGDKQATGMEFSYYYYRQVNYFLNTYSESGLLSYLGLDTSKSLSSQKCSFDSTKSWADYFAESAIENMKQTYILFSESEKNGFEPDRAEIDEAVSKYKTLFETYAENNGLSLDGYVSSAYGKGITWDRFVTYLEKSIIAEQYSSKITDEITVSEDEINTYFADNKASYYGVDFRSVNFSYTADDEASKTEAKAKADEFVSKVKDEETFKTLAWETLSDENKKSYEESGNTDFSLNSEVTASTLSSEVAEWMLAEGRNTGDLTVIDVSSSNVYTVYYFIKSELRDYKLANFRSLYIAASEENAEQKANEALEKWNASSKTEDDFIAIVNEYNSEADGGLAENVAKGATSDVVNDWIFAEGRKTGDTAVLYDDSKKDSEVYYVVYYVSDGDVYWHYSASSSVRSNKYQEQYNSFAANYETTQNESVVKSVIK